MTNATTWFYETIGKNLDDGFFVEIGVMNGTTQNSTIVLEKNGWNGLLVEPIPKNIKQIKKNRTSKLIEGAVWREDGYVDIIDVGIRGHTGIKETHRAPENAKDIIRVKSYKFNSLPVPTHIDYLQIDTEGSELEILDAIDMNKFNIDYICIEDTFGNKDGNPKYHNFMKNLGYERIFIKEQDRIYKKITP